jgi:Arc/MetJ-type ribon-helix-helix transcriptional regulator
MDHNRDELIREGIRLLLDTIEPAWRREESVVVARVELANNLFVKAGLTKRG